MHLVMAHYSTHFNENTLFAYFIQNGSKAEVMCCNKNDLQFHFTALAHREYINSVRSR